MKLSDDARKAIHDWRWGPYTHDPVERQDADDKMIKMVMDTFNHLETEIAVAWKSDRAARVFNVEYLGRAQKAESKNASARAIMQKFVDKVDRGIARSIETYAEMKQWMEEE